MTFPNRSERLAADQKLIDGMQKHLAQLPAVPVQGQSMTPADIVKVLQDRIAAGNAAIKADADRAAAVKADRDEQAKTAPVVSSVRKMVQAMFASNPDLLADFGLKDRKVTKPSAEKKAAAVAKTKATREARHTMGPKQKQAIHGTVPAASPATPKGP